ncbi:PREDICTED: putative calcium-transporting ATPase 11, plasma membrane-type, partial [Prunus mume]|uniref:Calcium-transporting ATPase 11, plasma membrane-type n=1 Tax=Prunus mume TaxID=102107 RepID=A0ABM0PWT4_PRUMU
EKIRVALYVQKAGLQFIDAGAGDQSNEKPGQDEYKPSEDARTAGFSIHPDELASITRGRDIKALKMHGGIHGILRKVSVSLDEGVKDSNIPIRQNVYGLNRYTEKPPGTFFMFVWEALQDLTLIILLVCAVVSIGVGIATEGWPKGMDDGVGILISIVLVVMVTAISDYRQSLQFKDLDREKKKIFVQVTRDKKRQKVSIYDLVVGDIVHLSIGDQVPADGFFISGYSLLIDVSSLSGESEPVHVYEEKPFLLPGTKVQDGSGIMLVTTVGMRTEWGKLMETLSEGEEDETPLQVKLNGVARIIGKIGLTFAVLTFLVLAVRFLVEKILNNEITDWSSTDAVILLNYFAIALTIIVVAVPEGLLLAVPLSLAFAMKKLMNDRALVRHLSACETMGSASCICTDKTGTLTTNHMVVNKIWICEKPLDVNGNESKEILSSEISGASSILLQVIFQNTSSEVIKEDGKTSILGTPTESALLEFGLLLGGDFDAVRREVNILKVFNEINCRDIEKINIFMGMFDSRVFLGVVVCTVAFQVIIVEFLGAFASTVPLSWQLWLLCILLGSVSMLVAVVLKNPRRRFRFFADLDKRSEAYKKSFSLSGYALDFQVTNNIAEYKALIIGLEMLGDSMLVMKQIAGECKCLNPSLTVYLAATRNLMAEFREATWQHIPRKENFTANEMAQIAIGVQIPEDCVQRIIKVRKKSLPSILTKGMEIDVNSTIMTEEDWRLPIISCLQ